MDFARINPRRDAEISATYHVEFDGERLHHDKKPIEMDFLGIESETGRRAAAKMIKEIDRKRKSKRDASKMGVDEIMDVASESELARARFYATLCTGWRNVVYIEDKDIDDPKAAPKPLEFSRENAIKLFSTRPWIMEGIDSFLADKSNFLRSALTD